MGKKRGVGGKIYETQIKRKKKDNQYVKYVTLNQTQMFLKKKKRTRLEMVSISSGGLIDTRRYVLWCPHNVRGKMYISDAQ